MRSAQFAAVSGYCSSVKGKLHGQLPQKVFCSRPLLQENTGLISMCGSISAVTYSAQALHFAQILLASVSSKDLGEED